MPRVEDDCGIGQAKDQIVEIAAWLIEQRKISISECVRKLEEFRQDAINNYRQNTDRH